MTERNAYAPWLFAMARVFEKEGKPLWLVGGGVRNPLMGLPISDVDVCGPALPQEVCVLCEGTPVRAVLRAAHFGTVELHVADQDGTRHMAEYTTFREDSYRCGHQPSAVRFTTNLVVDALRRDFSVNALYRLITSEGMGEISDPVGGLSHLRQRVLHTVTQDPDQVFKDDGLRILRAARFQAELGLVPTAALLDSSTRYGALLQDIAPERLRDEFEKVLLADFRYPMLLRKVPATWSGLKTLWQIGVWPYLFSQLGFSPEEGKALEALRIPEGISPAAARLGLLFWREQEDAVREGLLSLHFANRDAEQAAALAGVMWRLQAGGFSVFHGAQAGVQAVTFAENGFAALACAQGKSYEKAIQAAGEIRKHLEKAGIPGSLKALAVNGNDLLPLCRAQGKRAAVLGRLLMWLWRSTVEERLPNGREALLSAAEDWLAQEGSKDLVHD